MNAEGILNAVYEDTDGRALTPRETAELVNFLSFLIGKLLNEPSESRMIH
jgi:hypothetical protein